MKDSLKDSVKDSVKGRATGWAKFLPFIPSIAIGVAGVLWVWLRPMSFTELFQAQRPPLTVAAATVAFVLAVLGLAWILEKVLPSFRYAGNLMERILTQLDLPLAAIVALAVLTAASEEIMFRGALLQEFGIWPQAVLFGLLHPATRKGWSYPVFAFFAALGFGWLTLFTGTLWAPLTAHFAINLHGLLEARRRSPRKAS